MMPHDDITSWLQGIHRRATAGYALALHFGAHSPLYLFQTLPAAWTATYTEEGVVLRDPVAAWGLAKTGRVTWADLAPADSAGVLGRAADHGLRHGLAVAVLRGGSRSVASVARGDRPFSADEAADLEAAVTALHDATRPDARLSPAQREVLRRLSMAFSRL